MKITYRWLSTLTVVMLLLGSLAGCGGEAAPAAAPTATTVAAAAPATEPTAAAPATEPTAAAPAIEPTAAAPATEPTAVVAAPSSGTVLQLWIMPNTLNTKADMDKTLASFKQKMGVDVEVTVLDWGAAFTKIQSAIISGEGPDITQLGTTWVGAMTSVGKDAPGELHTFTADEITALGGEQAYFPAAWNTAKLYGTSNVTAIPWFLDVRALYYRTDMLKKAGVDPAKDLATWEGFDAAMAKVKASNNLTTTFAFPGKNDWNVVHNFAPYIWSYGGDMLTADVSKAVINSPEAVAGIKAYTGFVGKGYTDKATLEKNSSDAEAIFKGGNAAFLSTGSYIVGQSRRTTKDGGFSDTVAGKNMGVAPMPAGPKGSITFVGGSNLAMLKSSKHPKEAMELLKFLVGQEAEVAYAQLSGNLPASKSGYGDPYFSNDPQYQVFINAAGTGKSYPTIAAWGGIEEALKKGYSNLWDDVAGVNGPYDDSKVQSRMDEASKEVDAVIESNK